MFEFCPVINSEMYVMISSDSVNFTDNKSLITYTLKFLKYKR